MRLVQTFSLALAANKVASVVWDPNWHELPEDSNDMLPLSNARFEYPAASEETRALWSTIKKQGGPPEKCIDGVINVNDDDHPLEFCHSETKEKPEFLVDVPDFSVVTDIVIYPRFSMKWQWEHHQRYQHFKVFVDDFECTPINADDNDEWTLKIVRDNIYSGLKFDCDSAYGKTIKVTNENWIHMNEIVAEGFLDKPPSKNPKSGENEDPCEGNQCTNGSSCVADDSDAKGYQCVCPTTNQARFLFGNAWSHWLVGEYCENISIKTPKAFAKGESFKKIQAFGYDQEAGVENLSFEFKVRAEHDVNMIFCGDKDVVIDKRFKASEKNSNCLELALGLEGNSKSIFRSSPKSDVDPIADFIEGPILNGWEEFSEFKLEFDKKGRVNVYNNGTLFMESNNWKKNFDFIRAVGVSVDGNNGKFLFDTTTISYDGQRRNVRLGRKFVRLAERKVRQAKRKAARQAKRNEKLARRAKKNAAKAAAQVEKDAKRLVKTAKKQAKAQAQAEKEAAKQAKLEALFKEFDTNGSGQLDKAEFEALVDGTCL